MYLNKRLEAIAPQVYEFKSPAGLEYEVTHLHYVYWNFSIVGSFPIRSWIPFQVLFHLRAFLQL